MPAPVTVTTTPKALFTRSETAYARTFFVAKADDSGATILVSYQRETLEAGGGIPYDPGTGRDIVGHSTHVGMPIWAKTTEGTSKVYVDEG